MNIVTSVQDKPYILTGTGFGKEVTNYTNGRKPYPKEVFLWIKSVVGKDAIILDMACGTGIGTIDLRKYVTSHVTGCDIDKEMLKEAKKLSEKYKDIRYVLHDACTMEKEHTLKKGSFDAICIFSAIHWLLKPKALKAIHSLLKPEGKLIIVDGEMGGSDEDPETVRFREDNLALISNILKRSIAYETLDGKRLLEQHQFQRLEKKVFSCEERFFFGESVACLKSCSFYAELSDDEKQKVDPALMEKVKGAFRAGIDVPITGKVNHNCYLYKKVEMLPSRL
jgi:ubiquinone/menaquinone biosynthesis C-methylase UbiE